MITGSSYMTLRDAGWTVESVSEIERETKEKWKLTGERCLVCRADEASMTSVRFAVIRTFLSVSTSTVSPSV